MKAKSLKKSKLNIKGIDVDIESGEDYREKLREYMMQYDKSDGKICIFRKPSSTWIRFANELLQSNFDHKRIWFGGKIVNIDSFAGMEDKIGIKDLTYAKGSDFEKDQRAKMFDFVDNLYDNLLVTKEQCASIEVSTNPQGSQSFDLPPNLKRQTGPDKARKDSYSALVLGNWMMKTWFDATSQPKDSINYGFVPILV